MKLKAKGYTRHRFWGEYSVHMVLLFDSREEALLAQPILNEGMEFGHFYNAGGGYSKSEGFRNLAHGQGDAARALFIEVADPVLTQIVDRLVGYGADKKKILSMARSIDYGEEFYIEIETPDPNQPNLL
jgi:hypothetical protein